MAVSLRPAAASLSVAVTAGAPRVLVQRRLSAALSHAFVLVALLLLSGALLPLLRPADDAADLGASDGRSQAIYLALYGVAGLLAVRRWRRFAAYASRDVLLLLLVGLALASVAWSGAPGITLRRAAAVCLTTAFGVFLASRYSIDQQLRLLALVLAVGAVLSVAAGLTLPDAVIAGGKHDGAWRGVYSNKQGFGRLMSLAVVTLLLRRRDLPAGRARMLAWPATGLALVLLALSQSRGAVAVLVATGGLFALLRLRRLHVSLALPILVIGFLGATTIAWLLIENAATILFMVGKDVTLSGRTLLWASVIQAGLHQPWLGAGFQAFWLESSRGAREIWAALDWEAPHAHNGLLQLWLDLGLLGVTLFVAHFVGSCRRGVAYLRAAGGSASYPEWPLLFFGMMLWYNVPSTTVLDPHGLLWIVYVALAVSLRAPRRVTPWVTP